MYPGTVTVEAIAAVLDLSTNLGSSFRLRNHSHLVKDLMFSPTKRLNRAHTVVNTRYCIGVA